jgi:N-acetylglucosaminyl-diphospho-decaprenol L-rhamnosyltransferase
MMLSIIIVNYNTGALTRACVESLLSYNLPPATEIIVVDNASQDESVSFLRSDWPEIRVIAQKENVGLARGVNAGIKAAKGKYYLILNPDIIVFSEAVKNLTQFMEQNLEVGIAGGKLLSPNGKVQLSCYRFYRPMTIIYRRTWLGRTKAGRREIARFLMKDFDRQQARKVEWLMGACLMVRAELVKEIGGMDERYFLYFEDVDWCRRAWLAGWQVSYVPGARFSHYHQRSSESGLGWGWILKPAVRHHIISAIKYFWKFRGQAKPVI